MCGVGIMGFLAKQLTRLDVIPWIKIAKNGFLIFGLILRFFVEGIVFIKEWAYDCYMHCECKITGKPYPRETGKTYIWNETELTSQLKEIDPVTGRVIVGVLIVVVVAVVLYFLIPQFDFGRVKHNIFKLNKKSFVIEGLSDRERFFVREKGKRGKMRGYYRQYLQYVRKIGFSVKPEDTSEDILKRVDLHEEKNAKARALRELYIKTRYCEEYEPTAQELQAAKAILKALK
jgi:hypothetical protein